MNVGTSPRVKKRIADNKAKFLAAYRKAASNMSSACESVGISRNTVEQVWMKKDAAFAASVNEQKERMIDFVESALMKNIIAGNVVAQIFFLKCQGKIRGYVERQEITGKDGESLDVVYKVYKGFDPKKV